MNRPQCWCPTPLVDVRTSGLWAVCGFCGGACRNPFAEGPIRAVDGRDWEDRAWDWLDSKPPAFVWTALAVGAALFWWGALTFMRWLFACALAAGLN